MKVLAGALRIYLEIQPDELLLAIIDRSGGRAPAGGCALTTRRFHWAGRHGRADSTSALVDERGQPRPPLGRAVAYGEIAEVSHQGIRLVELDPNSGGRVAFGTHGLNVSGELAVVLKNLREVARGERVALSSRAEELARADLPKVRRMTSAARAVQRRMRSFPELLKASTPRVLATPAIVTLCVLWFAMIQAHGVPSTSHDAQAMWVWGGNYGPSVLLDGEFWRLFSSMFVHLEFLHLAFNMWCLLWFGPLVERLFGRAGFVALYLISGLGGAIASLWYHPMVVSAGASGAIFGIFGALIGYLIARQDVSPSSVLQLFRPGVIVYLVVDSLLGLTVPSVDGAAHVGGFATGCVCGLVLHRPWPSSPINSGKGRRLVAVFGLALGLLGIFTATAGGIRARIKRDPQFGAYLHAQEKALADYRTFTEALQPGSLEFDAIAKQIDETVDKMDRLSLPKETILHELDALIVRAAANETRLTGLAISDPELRIARDHVVSAQQHYSRAMKSLKSFVTDEKTMTLLGSEGYRAQVDAASKDVEAYTNRRTAFMKAHDLIDQPR